MCPLLYGASSKIGEMLCNEVLFIFARGLFNLVPGSFKGGNILKRGMLKLISLFRVPWEIQGFLAACGRRGMRFMCDWIVSVRTVSC